ATSCRSCFLFWTLRLGRTDCGSMISARVMMALYFLLRAGWSGSRTEMRIDPADIAVGPAVDDIETAVARIAEQQELAGRDVELHHRLAHRELRHVGGTFRNDDGAEILRFLGIVVSCARNDVVRGSAPTHRLGATVIVTLEPALVAPELLLEMGSRLV